MEQSPRKDNRLIMASLTIDHQGVWWLRNKIRMGYLRRIELFCTVDTGQGEPPTRYYLMDDGKPANPIRTADIKELFIQNDIHAEVPDWATNVLQVGRGKDRRRSSKGPDTLKKEHIVDREFIMDVWSTKANE